MGKSVEDYVSDWAKRSLDNTEVSFAKNLAINSGIDAALKIAPNKKGA